MEGGIPSKGHSLFPVLAVHSDFAYLLAFAMNSFTQSYCTIILSFLLIINGHFVRPKICQMVPGNIHWQQTVSATKGTHGNDQRPERWCIHTFFLKELSLISMCTSLTRSRYFGSSRNLWEGDYVTSQKNVCDGGYMSTYISKHKAFKTLVVQETNRSAKGFRYNGADAHGMVTFTNVNNPDRNFVPVCGTMTCVLITLVL